AKHWKIMKICAVQGMFALSLFGVSIAHHNYAQLLDKEITIGFSSVPFKEALRQIEATTGVRFFYSVDQLDAEEEVTLDVKSRRLGDFLDELFSPRHITYKVHEKEATITLKKQRIKIRGDDTSTEYNDPADSGGILRQVTGTVTDGTTFQPLPGVNILIRGSAVGTTTDSNGKFSIDADDGDVLVFSFIGYASVELEVKGQSTVDIVLR